MNTNIYEYSKKLGINHDKILIKGKRINLKKQIVSDMGYIKKTYNTLTKSNDLGIAIHPAGEWILDNLYIIQKEVLSILNNIDSINLRHLPQFDNKLRIYILANELVKYTDGLIDKNNTKKFLMGYIQSKDISLQELWVFPLMIKIALIKYIKQICEKISYFQNQRYKVESIIERLILSVPNDKRKYNIKIKKEEKTDINMPFIEYMAYRLKQLDENDIKYINAFDEQILKLGITVDEVVSREHFDIVLKQISISNSINSLKNINNINLEKEFETISDIDIVLSNEKANIYTKMDFDTIERYRHEVYRISKKTGISQKYICSKIIELCNNSEEVQSHSGYYLFGKGKELLFKELNLRKNIVNKRKREVKNTTLGIYLSYICGISIFITMIISVYICTNIKSQLHNNIYIYILCLLTFLIPISQLVIYLTDKMILKNKKPNKLPCMNFEKLIPEDCKTFVIIPTLLNSTKRVKELIESLETYYLSNRQENIFFALLGDTSEIDEKHINLDDEIIRTGKNEIEKLNKKYECNIPKFYFLYRDRIYNKKQGKYLGWERKRGLIKQFNRFLLYNENGNFNTNNIDREKVGKIKYVVTIDADTQVGINTIQKLVGIMAHPLNTPILNKNKTAVIDGYGIIQPRISTSIECCTKSKFSEIYAGYGGIDIYTNAISDIYQDIWGEGIFTGKGIYDLQIFSTVLDNQIPENTVLSHDLLEGSYIRCGLATNVEFIDGYPSRYNSYIVRQNRWLRGDIQISGWLCDKLKNMPYGKTDNPLNKLSRWKILDNLRRGLLDISLFFLLIFGISIYNIKWYYILLLLVSIQIFPIVIDKLLNIQNVFNFELKYIKKMGDFNRIICRTFLEIIFLPYKAITNIETFVKTIYRMKISKKYLLEWMTAEQAEKVLGKDLKTYVNEMYISSIWAVILIYTSYMYSTHTSNAIFACILGILWCISPVIAWYISKDNIKETKIEENEIDFLRKVVFDTWKYYETYLTEENNYLIPDNYQENRIDLVVYRTSSTNIGLTFTSIMCAYDFKIISKEKAEELIINILDTIDTLEKHKGNLYNWYNIKTLERINDNISAVDNGNYIAYLYVLKSFCINELENIDLGKRVQKNIEELDFTILYDNEKQLFSIEYNVRTNEKSKSYFDLLASESRILSYVSIAKGDIPYKHWYNLSRNLTKKNGYKGLLSWTGTSFEYFMPYGLMESYKYSLLDETYKFVKVNQIDYVKRKNMPWGISECAFNLYDTEYNYQYKAMGIPGLGLKRGLKKDLVISPYSSIMMLQKYPKEVLNNMHKLVKVGAYGKYGFYDSIDYTKERIEQKKYEIVKTFMAHHQGLILVSIDNYINSGIMQKRFKNNIEIEAFDILLQEKTHNTNIIKNEAEHGIYRERNLSKGLKKKYDIYEESISKDIIQYNVLSNKNYICAINNTGEGFSKIDDIYINRYPSRNSCIKVIIKNRKTDEIIDCMKDSNVIFNGYSSKFQKELDDINIEISNIILQEDLGQVIDVKIRNKTDCECIYDLFFYTEPTLSDINSYISHRAYSNMFLEFENIDNTIIVHRRKKDLKQKDIYLCNKCISSNNSKIDFEIDKYKFIGRNKDLFTSNAINKGIELSNSTNPTIEPIIAFKSSIKLDKNEMVSYAYIQFITNDINIARNMIQKYDTYNNIKRNFELSYNKAIVENKFYKYTNENIRNYQKIMTEVILSKNTHPYYIQFEDNRIYEISNKNFKQENLWKYGISGDNPIIAITINRKIENIFAKEMLEVYKYIKNKNIEFDLVILVNSQDSYIDEIIDEIKKDIQILLISQYLNNGIYILNTKDIESNVLEVIKKMSCIKFNGEKGNLYNQLNKLDKIKVSNISCIENIYKRDFNQDSNVCEIEVNMDSLLYYNEMGGFTKDGNEYKIILKNGYMTPAPWSNVLANKHFGTITNENGGGFTWWENSSQNKISKWENDQVEDNPSEYILIKCNNKIWSTTCNPIRINNAKYVITYGKGYSIYESNINNIYVKQTVFVSLNDKVKVCVCEIKNDTNDEINMEMTYNLNLLLGNEVEKKIYDIQYDKKNNCIIAKNLFNNNHSGESVYFTGYAEKVDISVDNYVQNKYEYKYPYIQLSLNVHLDKQQSKKVYYVIGVESNPQELQKTMDNYFNEKNIKNELESIKEYWNNITNVIKIKTPVESMNILMNSWLLYQTISSRLFARSGYYQVSGAYGFRDQLQDVLSVMYVNEQMAREQIIYHARHQFIEGDVQHWWHDENGRGIRSKYSDDLLWLAYVTLEYIRITGDINILNENVSYLESEKLSDSEKERYEIPHVSDIKENMYSHIIKAIDKSIELGKNNLPDIGSGDWSDGLNNVYGQSVWLGFFLYDILKKFLPIIFKYENDSIRYKKYKRVIEELETGLNNSWDGKWYKRAFFQDGRQLGSNENDECKIDSISQSWSVISNVLNESNKIEAMSSVDNLLVDRDNKLIRLFTPSFDRTNLEPGYIKAYLPGIRENGGQYTHAAIWAIMAQAILGNGNIAEEYFRILNPIEHARTNEACRKYKVEPYVMSADIYSAKGIEGRGGWTWYTGAASWMYKVGIEYILGFKKQGNILKIEPCINSEWDKYEIWYKYFETQYHIVVENKIMKQSNTKEIYLDNERVKEINLINDKCNHEVLVII